MIVDTHTHLYLDEFAPAPSEAVDRALEAGVGMMIFPNVDLNTVEPMLRLHEQYPEVTRVAMGLHPTEVGENWRDDLAETERIIASRPGGWTAIGEIGMDLYWDKTFAREQADVLERQMSLAAAMDLPVIIHCREALDEILEVIDGLKKVPEGVFHSFGGTDTDVEKIRRRGDFHFGINGIVTFKNSRVAEVLPAIGPDRLLLETDAPYLAPVPMRGKRNESAYIVHTAAKVASALGLTPEETADITTRNATRLFRL